MPERDDASRPASPESLMTNSLYRANATIDDLTTTLTKISRAPTPDDPNVLHCCCGRQDCESGKAWEAFQKKLESRLILCAEVGRALLEKHEAYVRRHNADVDDVDSDDESRLTVSSRPDTPTVATPQADASPIQRIHQLEKDIFALEKRLNTALLNSEVVESERKTLLQDLENAREDVSRLTASQARSIGWELRLSTAIREKEDLQQELESERQRAKSADSRISSLQERCEKQESDLTRLHDELELQKSSRTELSDEILRDARARLEMLQQAQLGHTIVTENPEVTRVMESLVADNEALKRDVAELQNLLIEARDDARVMREEMDEVKANGSIVPEADASRVLTGFSRHHKYTQSWASSFANPPLSPPWNTEKSQAQIPYEPLTPSTAPRQFSPADSHPPSVLSPSPRYPSAQLPKDTDANSLRVETPEAEERKDRRSPRRQLLLLTQTKAVQTDEINWTALLHPFARSSPYEDTRSGTPPTDGRSESSSLLEGTTHSSTVATLVERTNALFGRMSQADARTLTNRLKRQRLTGDVSHLSHATVSAIMADVNGLRQQFRTVLEDEKVTSTCTRKDLRSLLGLFREIFAELGQMRITLNDVVLDPSSAQRVSEEAMNPSVAKDAKRGRPSLGAPGLSAWMAPISKLFGSGGGDAQSNNSAPNTSNSVPAAAGTSSGSRQRSQKLVPKLGPALAASTTTVNVEFSGGGVGRSVSTAVSPAPLDMGSSVLRTTTPAPRGVSSSKAVLGIFAGAPRPAAGDPWVVIPSSKPERKLRNTPSTSQLQSATLSRAAGRRASAKRLPRNVDAIIDTNGTIQEMEDEGINFHETLLDRTLRPRGLSDSSIHSSFIADGEDGGGSALPPHASLSRTGTVRQGAYPSERGATRNSVLNSLSRTIQSFKAGPSTALISSSPPARPNATAAPSSERPASPRRMDILPSIASWAAAQAGLDANTTEEFVGSFKDEDSGTSARSRTWKRDMHGRPV